MQDENEQPEYLYTHSPDIQSATNTNGLQLSNVVYKQNNKWYNQMTTIFGLKADES